MAKRKNVDKVLQSSILQKAMDGVAIAAIYATEDEIARNEKISQVTKAKLDEALDVMADEIRDGFFAAVLSVNKASARKLIAQHEHCSEDVAAEVEANIAAARDARAASRKTQTQDAPSSQA